MRKQELILIPVALLLLGACLWVLRDRAKPEPLSREAQAQIIRQTAEQPSSWQGWELLHTPDPDWTDPERAEPSVQPVPQPLTPPEPFFLVDDSGRLTPEEAAREALHGMLHYIWANRAGEGYELLEFRVGTPRLLDRAEIVRQALERCSGTGLNPRTARQLREWCRAFFRRYPGLAEDMWVVEPAFSLKWSGDIDSVSYDACVENGLADGEGFVDLPRLFRRSSRPAPLLLIRQGRRYRLQDADAFFAQYGPDGPSGTQDA